MYTMRLANQEALLHVTGVGRANPRALLNVIGVSDSVGLGFSNRLNNILGVNFPETRKDYSRADANSQG